MISSFLWQIAKLIKATKEIKYLYSLRGLIMPEDSSRLLQSGPYNNLKTFIPQDAGLSKHYRHGILTA